MQRSVTVEWRGSYRVVVLLSPGAGARFRGRWFASQWRFRNLPHVTGASTSTSSPHLKLSVAEAHDCPLRSIRSHRH
nr:hypothetical protein CFP56_00269 [Quercus suber]